MKRLIKILTDNGYKVEVSEYQDSTRLAIRSWDISRLGEWLYRLYNLDNTRLNQSDILIE